MISPKERAVKSKETSDRNRLIRLIHVARRELAMDDDTYRDVLQRIGNVRSAADLDASKLQKVLDHLKACGFKVRPTRPTSSRPLAEDPESKKIRAIWLFLHQIGVVRDPSERALAAYVKRISGVDALQWTDGRQTLAVIESLKAWVMRFLPGKVKNQAAAVMALPITDRERQHLQALLNDAFIRMTYDPMLLAWEDQQDLCRRYQGGKSDA